MGGHPGQRHIRRADARIEVRARDDGGVESCAPSSFLCPASGLPVGYVRAYLHKFFDAIPFFRGTGYSDVKDEAPEFIMRNTKASTDNTRVKVRTTEAKDLTGACAES